MKTIVLIPARGGSKRIQRKNLADLGGVPLIVWTLAVCHELPWPYFVSTDDSEIAEVAREYGAAIIERPSKLCSDTSTDFDVVNHTIDLTDADRVVYLRPTTPFRRSSLIVRAVEAFDRIGACSGMRSVHKLPESAYKAFTTTTAGKLEPAIHPQRGVDGCNGPDQAYPTTYAGNGYVDLVLARDINAGRTFGHDCLAFITPPVV